ncbi:hypothetical protein KKJ04_19645 [Xenorhabdus bovienii]|uniref:hypothetical protein n=1 Tax=Xenorhabdus bovienii TaxID=40576 RepID=UPI0023B2A11C|nr:hypothetical protein [Xenorhabdus bovienii]MDE9447719.1 hypothetical protein [Xenorhabdus bovienii]MDE9536158.1 hypothetical protein [Xenorhabdus bovienii]
MKYDSNIKGNFARICLPYGIEISIKGDIQIINRDYHPIGEPVKLAKQSLDALKRSAISFQILPDGNTRAFFYTDACAPWNSESDESDYLKRIAVLIRIKAKIKS